MSNPNFDKILDRKTKHYGHTKAAYQFAAQEYAILCRSDTMEGFLNEFLMYLGGEQLLGSYSDEIKEFLKNK